MEIVLNGSKEVNISWNNMLSPCGLDSSDSWFLLKRKNKKWWGFGHVLAIMTTALFLQKLSRCASHVQRLLTLANYLESLNSATGIFTGMPL